MKKLIAFVLVTMIFFANCSTAFAAVSILPKIHLNSPTLAFGSETYSIVEKVQNELEAKSVNFELYVQPDVQYNMEDEAKILMSNMKNRNAHDVLILIATDRVNRLGSHPALRLSATSELLSKSETSKLVDEYYQDFSNKNFDYALSNLVTKIGEELATFDAAANDAANLFWLVVIVLVIIVLLWYTKDMPSSGSYSSGGYDTSDYSSDSSDGDD
jgi:hypothetical protein